MIWESHKSYAINEILTRPMGSYFVYCTNQRGNVTILLVYIIVTGNDEIEKEDFRNCLIHELEIKKL